MSRKTDHTLEFLLDFDGRIHRHESGHFLKFEIRRVDRTDSRPHGLRYSFTFHARDGTRLVGFDDAHPVAPKGSHFRKAPIVMDHWHRTEDDPGRPYEYKDANTLLADFFKEVYRIRSELGIPDTLVSIDDVRRKT